MGSDRRDPAEAEGNTFSVGPLWYIEDAAVTVSTAPRTIHDFGGFPRELYQVQYSAPVDPDLAARVQKLLAPVPVRRDDRWGLDHGTFSVLRHVYPPADIPVVQLSIDETQPPSFHYEVGKRLADRSQSPSGSNVPGDGTIKFAGLLEDARFRIQREVSSRSPEGCVPHFSVERVHPDLRFDVGDLAVFPTCAGVANARADSLSDQIAFELGDC